MKKVLCIAAHPDDEILGCGATLARHASRGDIVEVVIAAEGRSGQAQTLQAAAEKANASLGVKKVTFLGLPDNRLDSMELINLVQLLEAKIAEFSPEIIYTHFAGDLNIDHQLLNRAVLTACRPQPKFCVKEIYAFEVPSATHWAPGVTGADFSPDMFINTDGFFDAKMRSLEFYKSEMRDFPHARSLDSVKALAQWRGGLVGYKTAEAFRSLRILKD